MLFDLLTPFLWSVFSLNLLTDQSRIEITLRPEKTTVKRYLCGITKVNIGIGIIH